MMDLHVPVSARGTGTLQRETLSDRECPYKLLSASAQNPAGRKVI